MLGILFVCQASASDLKVDNPYPTDALLKKEDCANKVSVTAEVDIWSADLYDAHLCLSCSIPSSNGLKIFCSCGI